MSLEGLAQRILSSLESDELLENLRELLQHVPFPCDNVPQVMGLLPQLKGDKAAIVTLFELELMIFYSSKEPNHAEIEQKFKFLAPLSITNQLDAGSLTALTRIKYHDLLTDYQFLIADTRDLRLMELVTKKLNFLGSLINCSEPLVQDIQLKILVFYLLSGSDFRKRNVSRYLSDEGVFTRNYNEAIKQFERFHLEHTLVPLSAYEHLLAYLEKLCAVFFTVQQKHGRQLLENFLDNNVSRLPNYFSSIRLTRIQSLLQNHDVDIEDLVYRMIVAKKLPEGTTIDQIRGLVHFGEKPQRYDDFNTHIKSVCELVDTMASVFDST